MNILAGALAIWVLCAQQALASFRQYSKNTGSQNGDPGFSTSNSLTLKSLGSCSHISKLKIERDAAGETIFFIYVCKWSTVWNNNLLKVFQRKKKKRIQKLYIVCRCCLLSGCLIAWCYSSWLVTKCYCSSKGLKPNTLTCTNHQQLPVWSYQLHLCPYLCCLVGSKSFFSSLLHFFSYSKSHCLLIQRPLRSSALSTGLVKLCSPLSLLLITQHYSELTLVE